MKRFLFIIFTIIIIFSLTSCNDWLKKRTEGDFEYVIKSNDKAYITGFSDSGELKTELYIPETLGGKQVYGFGYYKKNKFIGYTCYDNFHGNVKKLYFNDKTWNILNCGYSFKWPVNLESSLLVFENIIDINEIYVSWRQSNYCCISYEAFINSGNLKLWNEEYTIHRLNKGIPESFAYYNMQIGNVNFIYNYNNSPYNGIYHFDSVDNDYITYIPEEPIREGYKFMGWYKEKECINLWDFNVDKTNDLIYARIIDEIDNYEYDGINLYAKWEKE